MAQALKRARSFSPIYRSSVTIRLCQFASWASASSTLPVLHSSCALLIHSFFKAAIRKQMLSCTSLFSTHRSIMPARMTRIPMNARSWSVGRTGKDWWGSISRWMFHQRTGKGSSWWRVLLKAGRTLFELALWIFQRSQLPKPLRWRISCPRKTCGITLRGDWRW